MFITCRVLDISFWKVDKYTYQIPKCKNPLKIAFSSKILLSEMKTSKRNAFCMVVKKWIFVALWHCSFVTRGSFFSQNIQSIAQNKKEIQTRIKKECFVSTWVNVFFQILPIEKWVLYRHFSSGQEVLKGTINMRINGQKEMSWIAILTIGTFPDENQKKILTNHD